MNDAMLKLQVVRTLTSQRYQRQVRKAYSEFLDFCSSQKMMFVKIRKDDDKRRLYSFKQFTEKTGLPFRESLAIIFEYWRQQRQTAHKKFGLPVSIAALTGNVSRRALQDYVEHEYSDNEHASTAQFMRREAMLNVGEVFTGRKNFERCKHASYAEEAAARREAREVAVERLKRHLRAYRGNPWL